MKDPRDPFPDKDALSLVQERAGALGVWYGWRGGGDRRLIPSGRKRYGTDNRLPFLTDHALQQL
jgi:hypothetical protein